jgi:hypothetical protein
MPDSLEIRVAAACAKTRGVACFPTAGVLWQLRKSPRVAEVHVTVPWSRRVTDLDAVTIHRSTCLPEDDVVRRRDGIALTSPPRTVFDAAAIVSAGAVESMIEQGLDRGMFVLPTLVALAHRLARSGRDGSARFRSVLASREAWWNPVRSDYELRLERAMRRRGFPVLAREHAVTLGDGSVVHPDLGIPEDGFFVEVDHLTWHGGRHESAYDRRRDTKVRLAGCHVERVTDVAIDHHLDETVNDLWELWQRLRGELARRSAG